MGSSNVIVVVALALFFPAVWWARRALGTTRGIVVSLLGGWLFLPVVDGRVLQVPLLGSKISFVPVAILLVSAAADWGRWVRLRLHWIDLAAVAVVVGPFVTALSNGLGPYEGASAMVDAFGVWGTPYLLGRIYLGGPRPARAYAVASVAAALVYVPLCLWEIRMSPQLHRVVYGYRAAGAFATAVRYGGYRPSVFMAAGLAVGTFMATATLIAYWLWRTRASRRALGVPLGAATVALLVTTLLVKSTGAIVLLAIGIAVLEASRLLGASLPVLALALVPPVFCAARISGWSPAGIVEAAESFDQDRAQSVQFRFENERMLLDKAAQRPWLGWGRWGRSRVFDDDGRDVSTTDSLWIIALGMNGRVGLLAIGVLVLAPVVLLQRRFRRRQWEHPRLASVGALAVAALLWAIDSMLNNMNGPLYPAMAGSIVSILQARRGYGRRAALAASARRRARPRGAPQARPAWSPPVGAP